MVVSGDACCGVVVVDDHMEYVLFVYGAEECRIMNGEFLAPGDVCSVVCGHGGCADWCCVKDWW